MPAFFIKDASVVAVAVVVLCGCQGVTGTPATPRASASVGRTGIPTRGPVIGVLFAGWHTGLILPVNELGPVRSRLPVTAGERYVSFGWGNRRFYMARRPSAFDALAALFPSASTMLVTAAPRVHDLLPSAATYRWVCATRAGVSRLDRYLLHALRLRDGKAIVLAPGPTSRSVFVASRPQYDAFETCNTWTATALKRAGIALKSDGVLFSRQLKRGMRGVPVCRRAARTSHRP